MDLYTQLQEGFVAYLRASLPEVDERVFSLVASPLAPEDLPAAIVEIGAEDVEYDEVRNAPDRILDRKIQVIVAVVQDAGSQTFGPFVRSLGEKVRGLLAHWRELGVDGIVDVRLATVSHEDFPSLKGRQGGLLLTYVVSFRSPEADPGTIIPLR